MDFLIWATRSLHLFAVVVWVGGLMFQSAVTLAVARVDGTELTSGTLHALRRFIPFVWMSVWTVLVTGIALMLFSTRFVLFEFHDRWSVLLLLKQTAFLFMVIFSFGFVRMFRRLEEVSSRDAEGAHEAKAYYQRMVQFGKINVALGIVSLLMAIGMR
jgi:uncharacterized membrane protein